MPKLSLNWSQLGPVGTELGSSQTFNVSGIDVNVDFIAEDEGARAISATEDLYVAPGEEFSDDLGLKLFGIGGATSIEDTSRTWITFSSTDSAYADVVQNVSFRLTDIDTGAGADIPGGTAGNHLDHIRVVAFDAEGKQLPVTITPGSAVDESYGTLEGTGDDLSPSDAAASALVEIEGPVAGFKIDYNNGDAAPQRVFVSDIHFETIPADGLDGIVEGTGSDDLIDLGYDGDPEGDRIDAGDNIFPGNGPDDDIVKAGGGDDTVMAGEGSDTVHGGDGGDDISTGNAEGGGLGLIDREIFPGTPTDPDPEDDRDLVEGEDGDDVISTGDDRDTIYGGAGNDTIEGGIDDDSVEGGAGNDSITDLQGADTIGGGGGNDTIIAGTDTFSDYVGDDPNLPLTGFPGILSDPNTEDGRDLVDAGNCNDYVETGDDADTILGGTGNDTLDGGIDDDSILGGAGHDSIIGAHGSDTALGGDGDDFIDTRGEVSGALFPNEPDATDPVPENDRDYVEGGAGNDTVTTGDDDDTVFGGAGDDVIDLGIDDDSAEGGAGADTIEGGAGDDTLTGGDGADMLSGGDDRDVFIGADAGDVIAGGGGGDDFDTLDLREVGPFRLTDLVPDAEGDGRDGTIEFLDADDNVTGTATFTNIEGIICFTPGTVIATPRGERLVEDLEPGDRVITRDNGIQEIAWTGATSLTGHQLARKPHMRPILIQAGALGNGLPEQDLLVSPNHRVLVANDKTALYFDESEVLVAAKHLTGLAGVDEVASLGVTYLHFMFERHEVVLSNGAWTESFQPGDHSLKGIGNAQRAEILDLFPELKSEGTVAGGFQAARRTLKKHEARLLSE
ncbi:type I secretion protein [Rhodosalinus halophilus]|uniref:Type I secretion protein n=1 Tax=Rhodosalinus halophilus TaxID=2259333 RepID=A0A365UAK6_9RHOB|nr:Hint domain-containing protein [Rhodosalinus halophilus]RBI85123.1 type I secretion protein [Rhodosalinus halophilus]